MRFQRRQLLRTLSFAFGSSFIWSRNQLGIAAQTAIQPKVSPPPALILTHIFGWTQGASEVDAQVFSTSRS